MIWVENILQAYSLGVMKVIASFFKTRTIIVHRNEDFMFCFNAINGRKNWKRIYPISKTNLIFSWIIIWIILYAVRSYYINVWNLFCNSTHLWIRLFKGSNKGLVVSQESEWVSMNNIFKLLPGIEKLSVYKQTDRRRESLVEQLRY